MAELPKIVRSRLAQQRSADHPDANLLAAFAERTLMERERATVLAHLSQCADCRESVALATVAQEPAVVSVTTERHWFLEWRWVGAVAACCVIAAALQYRVQPPAIEEKTYLVVRPGRAASLAEPPARQIAAAPELKVEHLKKALQLPMPAHLAQEQSPPSVMTQLDASAPETNPAAVAITPTESPAPSEQANKIFLSGIEPKAFRAEDSEAVRLQKDKATTQAKSGLRLGANAFAPGMVARAAVSRVSEPTVLWSINASPATAGNAHGVVERSLDAGKTWEVVPLSDVVSFRAVMSAGSHVWAGGTNGALFHSSDGGAHWEQIIVSDQGAKLNGTIVNIDARDTNLIKIAASSGEKWISSDGGRRWKRQ